MDKDTEFLTMAEAEMASLENWLEEAGDDFDCSRSGNVLTIELDSGEQVVVNIQTPMHEIWCASRFGGRTDRTLEDMIAEALRKLGGRI